MFRVIALVCVALTPGVSMASSYGDIRKLDHEQKRIIKKLIAGGRKHLADLPPRERRKAINTAIAVGYTESRYRNLPGGDRDSQGWRQERAMYYPNPRDLDASVKRFYDEYRADASRGADLGTRAQQVQQSGTPHVWDSLAPMANRIRKEFSGKAGGQKFSPKRAGATKTIPGVDNSDLRKQLKLNYLAERGKPGGLLELASGLKQAVDTPARQVPVKNGGELLVGAALKGLDGNPRLGSTGGAIRPSDIIRRAEKVDKINNAGKLPYQWGGGHGLTPAKLGELVDCSGFVSQLLGVSPRVSGQFAQSWGKPGKGKFVTVYANPEHVLMSVKDPRSGKLRWFGTSRQNPGGGAGEISTPDAGYLSGFTARHPGRAGR